MEHYWARIHAVENSFHIFFAKTVVGLRSNLSRRVLHHPLPEVKPVVQNQFKSKSDFSQAEGLQTEEKNIGNELGNVRNQGATNSSLEPQDILNEWFYAHLQEPYPSEGEKLKLRTATGMSASQINNWFSNKRMRYKRKVMGIPPRGRKNFKKNAKMIEIVAQFPVAPMLNSNNHSHSLMSIKDSIPESALQQSTPASGDIVLVNKLGKLSDANSVSSTLVPAAKYDRK